MHVSVRLKENNQKKKKNKITKQLSQCENAQSLCAISVLFAFEISPCKTKLLLGLHLRIKLHCRSCFEAYKRIAAFDDDIQGGPKVGIQLLNYFLCALKLPAVHFMWPKSRHTVNGENYSEILFEVVVPQLQTKPNFDELFFQQDGTSPHYALRVRDYLNKVFTQRWFGRTGSIEWPPCSPDLTPMDFFFWGVVKNKEYVKNKEKNPKTVNELKDCIYDAFREIDAN